MSEQCSFQNMIFSKLNSKKISLNHTKSVEQRDQKMIDDGNATFITDELREMWRREIEKYSKIKQEEVIID